MTTPDVDTSTERCPVLIGLVDLVELLPVAKFTVYRWRTSRDGNPPILPEPSMVVNVTSPQPTPVWTEDTIVEFAERRGLKLDKRVLAKIRKAQGH